MNLAINADGTAGHPRVTEHHHFQLPDELPYRSRPATTGNGMYKLPHHPETGRAASVSRATTVVKLLDDTFHLDKWKMRQVMLGLNRSPDIAAKINEAIEGEVKTSVIDGLVSDADLAAGSAQSREFGTAVHEWAEVVDAGTLLPCQVPELFREHVYKYLGALARHALVPLPEYTERIIWNPSAKAVGTLDRIFMTADGSLVLGDVKTSKSLEFTYLSYAAQLALYHGATHMLSIDGTVWEPMPALEPAYSILAHVPSDNADLTSMVTYDMQVGRAALDAAVLVRSMRATAKKLVPNQHAMPIPTAEYARQQAAVLALRTSLTVDDAVAVMGEYQDIWTDGLNTLGYAVVEALRENENAR